MITTSDIKRLVRPNIAGLRPYSSARSEFTGKAEVYLDANENPFENGLNRYPDPLAREVKQLLSPIKGVAPDRMVLGNGSDEIIDLIFRIFCEPGRDEVITLPPTYGMYRVSADINNVAVKEVPLLPGFVPDVDAVLNATSENSKVLWLCTPNNPSGNDLSASAVERLIAEFPGIVVIDEAYIDFAERSSYSRLLDDHPNLIVMQTFSKAWGMAGIRLGIGMASPTIVGLMNAVKPPYNVNALSQQQAVRALKEVDRFEERLAEILEQRTRLKAELSGFDWVEKVYPSDANFLLVKMAEPRAVYDYLAAKGIIVRDRSKQYLCEGCLRFTVGTSAENDTLLQALKTFQQA